MTASTDAASDSDTDSSPDISGETAADQPPTDDTVAGAAPGQDAGVGPGSLAFTSFLVVLLCLSPFYMLGSNLWGLRRRWHRPPGLHLLPSRTALLLPLLHARL